MYRVAICLLVAVFALSGPAPASAEKVLPGCTAAQQATTGCVLRNNGTEIVIGGTQTTGGGGPQPDYGDYRPNVPVVDSEPWVPPWMQEFDECLSDWEENLSCFSPPPEEEPAEEDDTPALPVITITDLVQFAPLGTSVYAEPDNVGVAGLPVNFVAAASVQNVSGSLFGFPVTVRFTPVGYDFAFGDDEVLTTGAVSQSWVELGQAQFTPTPTSHTYRDRGSYQARVDLRYTAEVDFGMGWYSIDGEVTSTGASQEVRIFEAHTALVAYTCEQSPSSPGC